VLRLVYTLAVATWLGTLVCLTFVVTPTAHGSFTAAEARRLLRPLFPRCYALGIACGFAALGAVALGRASLPDAAVLRLALPPAAALLATVVGRQVVLPQLRRLDGDDPRFARWHQASTMLSGTALGALVLALAAAVTR